MNESESYKAGLAVRKQVLGEKYVNESLAQADEFSVPLQQYLTEHAWGAVWVREAALNNGVTKEEIREIFLHCGAYCGAAALRGGQRRGAHTHPAGIQEGAAGRETGRARAVLGAQRHTLAGLAKLKRCIGRVCVMLPTV